VSNEQRFVVRWSECDANGHLRNTAYSEYCIDTRTSFLAERGFPHEWFKARSIGPVILREEIDYLREVRLGEEVVVDLLALGLSSDGARFRLSHGLRRPGGEPVAQLVLLGGWLDLERRRLTLPPEELKRAIASVPRGDPYVELDPLKPR
jgi:acyl-CoA thioester hydrolase